MIVNHFSDVSLLLSIQFNCHFFFLQADGEEPIVSDTEEDGSRAKKAQLAAEQAAAKIMPPPPTPPVSLHKGPVISSAANKMHQIAPKVRQ